MLGCVCVGIYHRHHLKDWVWGWERLKAQNWAFAAAKLCNGSVVLWNTSRVRRRESAFVTLLKLFTSLRQFNVDAHVQSPQTTEQHHLMQTFCSWDPVSFLLGTQIKTSGFYHVSESWGAASLLAGLVPDFQLSSNGLVVGCYELFQLCASYIFGNLAQNKTFRSWIQRWRDFSSLNKELDFTQRVRCSIVSCGPF